MSTGKTIANELSILEMNEMAIDSSSFESGMKNEIEKIDGIEGMTIKIFFRLVPTGLSVEKITPVLACLRWDKESCYTGYVISIQEGNGDRDGDKRNDNGRVYEGDGDHCAVYRLRPSTTYEFRVMGKCVAAETKWSEPLCVKTLPKDDNKSRCR